MLPLNRLFFSTYTGSGGFRTLFIYTERYISRRRERKITKFIKDLDNLLEVYWTIYYFQKYEIFVFRNDSYLRNFITLLTKNEDIPPSEYIYLIYNYNIYNAQNRICFF